MNSTKRGRIATAAAFLLTMSGLAAGAGQTYYRWLDEAGNQVNSDRPPPAGVHYEVISTSTNLLYEEDPADASAEQETAAATAQRGESATQTAKPQASPKDPELCANARQNLETLKTYARIRVQDDDGNYRYIDEEEKAVQRKQAEDIIAQYCD